MPLKQISLEAIDLQDLFFVITFAPDMGQLRDSIARVGILHPPTVQEISPAGRHRIVSGYKRLKTLEILGTKKVTAHISPSENELQLFLLNLEENLGTRPLNTVEKALALDKLVRQFGLSRETILRDHLPALNLGSDPDTLDLYLSLSELEDEIKVGLATNRIAIVTAHELTTLAPTDRLAFVQLVDTLSLGKNPQREFLALLTDLGRQEKSSIGEILKEEDFLSEIRNEKTQTPLRAKRVRELLIRRRYPRYSQVVEQFEALKKKLRFPPHVSLRTSPFFEGQDYKLMITFRSREQLAIAQKAIKDIAETSVLAELFEFTLGDGE
jgi:ParB-like chromosome segregation protein Spo0J